MDFLKRIAVKLVSIVYPMVEKLGFHIMPVYHASPIPRTSDLTDELFASRSSCIGIDWNLPVQEHYRDNIFPIYGSETEFVPNTGLSVLDSLILYSMIRHHKPKKIVEIGSGFSTEIAARACLKNADEGSESEFITVDPEPSSRILGGLEGLTRVIKDRVENLPTDTIIDSDLLFIDSSHVVKIGGDVNHEILELVPRLKKGALVHWHDILLPGEYWKEWIKNSRMVWSEQYLLHAFMKFNYEFEIQWASSYMQINFSDSIEEVLPVFRNKQHRITSFWVKRKS